MQRKCGSFVIVATVYMEDIYGKLLTVLCFLLCSQYHDKESGLHYKSHKKTVLLKNKQTWTGRVVC